MAQAKAKRRSRKRRNPDSAPRAVRSERRDQRERQQAVVTRERQATARAVRSPGAYGHRPEGLFGGLPVSEVMILAGLVAVVVGVVGGAEGSLVVGAVVCAVGVIEITAREHFSGFRSHATLLAAFPAVAVEVALGLIVGGPAHRQLILLPAIPVFGVCFWLLRRRFRRARQRRVARGARA
jgi:hypothetical protein